VVGERTKERDEAQEEILRLKKDLRMMKDKQAKASKKKVTWEEEEAEDKGQAEPSQIEKESDAESMIHINSCSKCGKKQGSTERQLDQREHAQAMKKASELSEEKNQWLEEKEEIYRENRYYMQANEDLRNEREELRESRSFRAELLVE